MAGLICFMSDFGLRDPYVAQVKAVLLARSPGSRIVDLAHEIPPFCVSCGSYILYSSYKWFPENTVFLCVIDPGVGSERRALVCRAHGRFFVGPDNGLLWQVLAEDPGASIYSIDVERLGVERVSSTFHGRDVFAPAAAAVSQGRDPAELGTRVSFDSLVKLPIRNVWERGAYKCFRVIHVDRFGNTVLSATREDFTLPELGSRIELLLPGGRSIKAWVEKTFSRVSVGEALVYYNSFDFIEIAVNMGSASRKLGLNVGDEVCIAVPRE